MSISPSSAGCYQLLHQAAFSAHRRNVHGAGAFELHILRIVNRHLFFVYKRHNTSFAGKVSSSSVLMVRLASPGGQSRPAGHFAQALLQQHTACSRFAVYVAGANKQRVGSCSERIK